MAHETKTPKQIDTELSELCPVHDRAVRLIAALEKDLAKAESGDARYRGWDAGKIRERIAGHRATAAKVGAEIEEREAEFRARGGWNRYFLVLNNNGHVHRERTCSTCFATTSYGWLPELSDCDEAAMVAEYGTSACTVCFPDAPTSKAWQDAAAREKAEAEAKAAEFCDAAEMDHDGFDHGRCYPRARCNGCGEIVSPKSKGSYAMRKHRTPEQKARIEAEKKAAKAAEREARKAARKAQAA